jgi:ribosome biogenesis GTPase
MQGTIVKGIAGFYYVKHEDAVYQCKARGNFRNDGIKPMVGDFVTFEEGQGENDDGWITEIHDRKNSFIRPPISNVDCFVIVMAAAQPKPNLAVMDKFLVMAEKSGTDIVLCVNKTDLAKKKTLDMLNEIYGNVYPMVFVSCSKGEGLDDLKALLKGKHVALAGPSGVGKSTILNHLIPGADAETGSISHKSKRGKHTTRHSELFDLGDETMLFDTPGFTSFDILEADEEELQHLYPEIAPYAGKCRYDNCRHIKEPECAVIAAVEAGEISQQRYDSYKTQLEEIREKDRY